MLKNKKKLQLQVNRERQLLCDTSPFAVKEAYNMVRTKLMFTGRGEKCPVYVITSSDASEGKTTNAINLSISFAMAGKKVLLIDADMRKPHIAAYLHIRRKNGLSEILAQIQSTPDIRQTQQENLYVMTSGNVPPNPSELIGSPVFAKLLKSLSEQFEYIFIDTPPIGAVTDASLLAEIVTGYILVVRSMKSDIRAVQHTVQLLKNLQGNIVGFLINDAEGKGREYYKKGYGNYGRDYGYGDYNNYGS